LSGSNGAPRTFWVDVTLHVAIVCRVGIDDAADRSVVLRNLGFDTTKRVAVANNYDLAGDVDSHLLKFFVVTRQSVVRENKWTVTSPLAL
jgi:hypothetical protein